MKKLLNDLLCPQKIPFQCLFEEVCTHSIESYIWKNKKIPLNPFIFSIPLKEMQIKVNLFYRVTTLCLKLKWTLNYFANILQEYNFCYRFHWSLSIFLISLILIFYINYTISHSLIVKPDNAFKYADNEVSKFGDKHLRHDDDGILA